MIGVSRGVLAAAGVAAVLGLSACGSGGGDRPAPVTATGSLEQLASEVDCAPQIQTDTAEIRQAICAGRDAKFILATFATDEDQLKWLDAAQDYGGHYLVGTRWVVVGGTEVTSSVRERLGGVPREGQSHDAGSGGHGGMAAHPGHG